MQFSKPIIQHISESDRAVGMFPITRELMGVIMDLEGRSILLKSGAYSFVGSANNVQKLREFFGEDLQIIGGIETAQAKAYANVYTPLTVPYDHQKRAADFLAHKTSAAVFAEQGTGKTKIAIDHFCNLFLNHEIDCVVVVAPNGVHRQWVNSELKKHCGIAYDPFIYYGKPKSWVGRDTSKLVVITTTYGKLCSVQAAGFLGYLQDEFKAIMFIMDESHFIKGTNTKRWKGCYEFSKKCKYRLALTGTPIAKRLADEWAQLKCVDENVIGINSLAAFQREYESKHKNEYNFYSSNRPKNDPIQRFKDVTKEVVFRCRKDELDIAPKTYSEWHFDMMPEQRKVFRQVALDLRAEIEDKQMQAQGVHGVKKVVEFACMAMVKLRQVGSGFIFDQDKNLHEIMPWQENPRIIALREIIESHDEPIIVWYNYIHDGVMIAQMLDDSGITYGNHRGSTTQRLDAINQFNDNSIQVFLSNPGSGGVGLNLQSGGCRLAVFYSHNDNSIQRWQAEDRIHRIGQKGICEYISIVGDKTTDATILHRTAEKKRLADYTLDDIFEELDEYTEDMEGGS